jgi:hypothetical protein
VLDKFDFDSWNIDLGSIFKPFLTSNSGLLVIINEISESFKFDSAVSVDYWQFFNLKQLLTEEQGEGLLEDHGSSNLTVSQVNFYLSMFIKDELTGIILDDWVFNHAVVKRW